jgi:glutathione S-transferase
MKLLCTPASPFARKALVVARELGLSLETQVVAPLDSSDPLHSQNPLGRVPALICDDGFVLVDSPVICEYLLSLKPNSLLPTQGFQRWQTLRLQALADGIMDSAVSRVFELRRPSEQQSQEWLERRIQQIDRTLAFIEANCQELADWNLGTLSLVCAWDYLEFRMPDMQRPDRYLKLAAALKVWQLRPSVVATKPQ